jgi:hypothetical protein
MKIKKEFSDKEKIFFGDYYFTLHQITRKYKEMFFINYFMVKQTYPKLGRRSCPVHYELEGIQFRVEISL